jgi:hypothetical protein
MTDTTGALGIWVRALEKRAAELEASATRHTAVAHEFAASELRVWAAMMRDAGTLDGNPATALGWLFERTKWSQP